jgi:hypothetical protein
MGAVSIEGANTLLPAKKVFKKNKKSLYGYKLTINVQVRNQ